MFILISMSQEAVQHSIPSQTSVRRRHWKNGQSRQRLAGVREEEGMGRNCVFLQTDFRKSF